MSETTLRDIIESAVDEQPEIESPVQAAPEPEVEETAEQKTERARDEAGRFSKAQQEATPLPAEEPERKRPQRPSSWKKEYWEKWDALDPDLAEYVLQREQQYAQGVSTYKGEADKAREFQEILAPHAPRFQSFGVTPTAYVGRLLHMDQILSTGTQQEKINMLQSIANAVGIGGQQPGVEQGQQSYVPPELMQTVGSLQNEIQQIKAINEAREQAQYTQQIEEFAQTAPYLDELQEDMAQLLEKGLASDLPDAYRKALAWNEELSAKAAAEQRSEREKHEASKQTAARARSSAVSPRSSTPTGSGATSQQGGDLRAQLEASMNALSIGGRI